MPNWQFVACSALLSKEPSPEERIEVVVAYLCALTYNAKKGRGKKAKSIKDFMIFSDAWAGDAGEKKGSYVSDQDVNDDINTLIDALGRDKLIVNRRK